MTSGITSCYKITYDLWYFLWYELWYDLRYYLWYDLTSWAGVGAVYDPEAGAEDGGLATVQVPHRVAD